MKGRRDGERFDVFRKNDARKRARPFEIERVSIYLIKRRRTKRVFGVGGRSSARRFGGERER